MILLAVLICAPPPTEIAVDLSRLTPISPYIYGVNNPDWRKMPGFFTLARQGGNRMSAYNWETNASNAGSDYRHQNDGYMGQTVEPGWTARVFIEGAHKKWAALLLTVPTMGYVSADKGPDNDVNRTPNYLQTRFHKSLPSKPGGRYAYPPDTKDKVVYQDEFVAYAERINKSKVPLWFSLDNEPDLWGHTHQRIWPKNPTYAQILTNNINFSKGIKAVAPKSLIFGPANYGWQGFRTFQNAPDARGRDFLDFYLDGMRDAEKSAGKRLMDVLDIHWYPEAQGDNVRIVMGNGQEGAGTAQARIQASRSLWDPTYVENSWITRSNGGKPIALLPGVQKQIRSHYPGTKLAITEYDFGGGSAVSGLLAQADVLGIWGRYGLFAACHWGVSVERPATIAGFQAFRGYDGLTANFGDQALQVSGEDAVRNSVYAAVNAGRDPKLTLVAINKTREWQPFQIAWTGFRPRAARGFLRDAANITRPKTLVVTPNASGVSFNLPPESVGTVEVGKS